MYLSVTESTQQFKVVPVKCDNRIVYVVRCQLSLVVNYLAPRQNATTQTPFTKMPTIRCITVPAFTPCACSVELPCKRFRHIQPKQKDERTRPVADLIINYLS